jgi:AcrR family transcriptional regulator
MTKESNSNEKDPARDALLRAGLKLFARDGLEGTTVRDIAAEAGVNLSLVSYHFGGKEALYRACIEELGRDRESKFQEILKTPQTLEEFGVRFHLFVSEMINFQLETPEACKIVMREIDSGLPVAADIFEKKMLKNFMLLTEFFESGQKKGFLRKSLDPSLVVLNLQGSIFHHQRVEGIRKKYFKESLTDPKYRQKAIDQLCELFLNGVVNSVENAKG